MMILIMNYKELEIEWYWLDEPTNDAERDVEDKISCFWTSIY
jgi:hypothetical protein